jgi:S-DNA-T family DNA segregation ATPase FtsK/SpoIIIE
MAIRDGAFRIGTSGWRRNSKPGPGFLPSGTGEFFRKRLIEICGLALLALAAAILVACLTFNPADPSFNRAAEGPALNLLGPAGAYGADLLLQSLGLATLILPLVLAGWGWRLTRRHLLGRWWLRLIVVALLLPLASAALAALPTPASWPAGDSLGGFLGAVLLSRGALASALDPWMLAAAAGFLATAGLAYALGLSAAEWRALGRAGAWTLGGAGRGLYNLARRPALFARTIGGLNLRRAGADTDSGDRREPRLHATRASADAGQPESDDEIASFARGSLRTASSGLVAPKRRRAVLGKRGRQAGQRRLDFGPGGGYELPPLALLAPPKLNATDPVLGRDALEKNARLLETVLDDFGVRGQIVKVHPGPVVTRYELEPAPGTKTSRVIGLADDIARSMSAISVRVAVVPGSSAIGIELPNAHRETVFLRELLGSRDYEDAGGKLPLILGKDISGAPMIVDLWRMPHLLIAGTTGSGKSVGVNSMILSLLFRLGPERCKLIMIDPKMLELSVYEGIPHLLAQVVTEPKKAIVALKWTVREMEERYRAMSRLGVRNVEGYNGRIEQALKTGEVLTRRVQTGFDPDTGQPIHEEQPFELEPLPYIVVVVDEMADLMMVAGKEIEITVQRLAQMARAAGIHLIMATQRPSVDVITGTIKANFPTRISFHVTSKIDSRTILGEQGAEQLLGQGDMLYMAHGGRILRVHGPLVTDQEVEDVVAHLKKQGEGGDDLYDRAVAVVHQHRKASTSFIQRHLQIGYNRAARIVERMEAEGVVSQANHVGKREVLLPGGAP